jgi:Family of unknown function (DUF6077)
VWSARALERLRRGVPRFCDGLLDFVVLAFAAWTIVYHLCLVLRIGAAWAAAAWAITLVPCAWLVLDREGTERSTRGGTRPAELSQRRTALALAQVATAILAGSLLAFTDAPWRLLWVPTVAAAAGAAALTFRRSSTAAAETSERTELGTAPALTWAVGLATLSLFLVRPDADDTYYVRLSTWVAAHGTFPLRDVLFSDEAFPAIIFPPVSSFEGLVGAVARWTDVSAPTLLYLVVTPAASALAVLALWRLLRSWGLWSTGLALSVSLAFLLFAAQDNLTPGNFFIGRLWQGKVIFAAILVPLLFVLLKADVERPTWRRLVLLAAAGTAAVGLTSSAAFVVPVLAAGCLLPFARGRPRTAAVAYAATAAYPLGTLLLTAALGSRRAAEHTAVDAFAPELFSFFLGEGVVALLAVLALLLAPRLIPSVQGAQMTAMTVLVVVCLFFPPVVSAAFDLTGLGRVFWRWTWAIPTAALVGVLATQALAQMRPAALRALPAAAVVAALILAGTPVWSRAAGTTIAEAPAWKRHPSDVRMARRIVAAARPGDVILAPEPLSQTILFTSNAVTTVSPRYVYTEALQGVPGAHASDRLLLDLFAGHGLTPHEKSGGRPLEATAVIEALRAVGVDVACLAGREPASTELLREAGYAPLFDGRRITCVEARSTPAVGG